MTERKTDQKDSHEIYADCGLDYKSCYLLEEYVDRVRSLKTNSSSSSDLSKVKAMIFLLCEEESWEREGTITTWYEYLIQDGERELSGGAMESRDRKWMEDGYESSLKGNQLGGAGVKYRPKYKDVELRECSQTVLLAQALLRMLPKVLAASNASPKSLPKPAVMHQTLSREFGCIHLRRGWVAVPVMWGVQRMCGCELVKRIYAIEEALVVYGVSLVITSLKGGIGFIVHGI
ncbi:hypothetical protein B0H19DRAFT_1084247 [Mycena capillaripes]|nr:hypothetical protein B0H19DRAFT_1084247 [Mycena capillaripes]